MLREAGREQPRAGGEAGSATSRTPTSTPALSPLAPAPRCAQHPARLGATGRERPRAAPPPPSPGACSPSPRGFTFCPGPWRRPAAGELQPARGEGELGAGEAAPGDPRRVQRARPGLRLQALCSRGAPNALGARRARGGAERGPPGGRSRNGSSAGERRQVVLGSSSLGTEVGGLDSLPGLTALRKDMCPLARAAREVSDRKGCVLGPPGHIQGTKGPREEGS